MPRLIQGARRSGRTRVGEGSGSVRLKTAGTKKPREYMLSKTFNSSKTSTDAREIGFGEANL